MEGLLRGWVAKVIGVCWLILMQPRIPWEEGFSGGFSRSGWPMGMSAGDVVLLIN